jgi:hypothetical protein
MRQFYIFTLITLLLAGGATGRAGAVKKSAPMRENHLALRKAIKDLMTTFGDRYPEGKKYLRKLDDIERRMNKAGRADIKKIQAELNDLQRKALIANPLVSNQPILFVVRKQYKKDHHNTATMFKTISRAAEQ